MRRVVLLLTFFVALGWANDARINALGGSNMYRDPEDIYFNPAFITSYSGLVEGNITGFGDDDEYLGSGLATWKIGKLVSIGGTLLIS